MNQPYFIIALFLIIQGAGLLNVNAQETRLYSNSRHRLGFTVGYGNQKIGGLQIDSEHDYEVLLINAQYHFLILDKRTWTMDFLLLPQFNNSKFIPSMDSSKNYGYELGLSTGIQFNKRVIKDDIDLYLLMAFGPHYVSGVPERQAAGFIFSDSFAIGIISVLVDRIFMNINIGIRHLSNASIKSKNGGVNNVILNAGLLFNLQK